MSIGVGRAPNTVIAIEGFPFFVALNPQTQQPEWHPQSVQTQEGDPTAPRRFHIGDFSRGMGDSRGRFKGAVEFSSNAWLGSSGRLLPGPKVGQLAFVNAQNVVAFAEVGGRLITFGDRYAKEYDSTLTLVATGDMGAGKTITGAQLFQGVVAIGRGDADSFYYRDALGAYNNNTLGLAATCWGLTSAGDLVRGTGYNWSHCSAANFYSVANWSATYPIGDKTYNIAQVGTFERWDYVLKPEGLYSFDVNTSAAGNVLPDLQRFASTETKRWFPWFNRLMICSFAGLYRYIQLGGARTVGMEEVDLNESVLSNAAPTCGIGFGKWGYVAYYAPSTNTTYVLMVRPQEQGDATPAPFTVVCCIDSFTGKSLAMYNSSVTGDPRLYYDANGAVRWFKLARDGKPLEFIDSGTTIVDLSPSDFGTPSTIKYFRGVELVGRNAVSVQLKARMDGGAQNNVGAPVTSFGSMAKAFWAKDANDSGRVMQLSVAMANSSPSAPSEIRDITVMYEERPDMVPGYLAVLEFLDQNEAGEVSTRLSAYDQWKLLDGYLDGHIVTITDLNGETYSAGLSTGQGEEEYQFQGQTPQNRIQVMIRRLDYS